MSETNNKSEYSNQTNREKFFSSQVNIAKKKQFINKLLTENLLTISSPNFVSFKAIDEENKSFSDRKNQLFLQRSPHFEKKIDRVEIALKTKNVSLNIYDISALKNDQSLKMTRKNSENLKNNFLLKYINFNTPKTIAENNQNLNAKLVNFEKNLSLRTYCQKNVQKWKNEHLAFILLNKMKKKNF